MKNNLVYKRHIARVWRALSKRTSGREHSRCVVLLYHALGKTANASSPELFEEQLRYLRDFACVVDLKTLWQRHIANASALGLTCCITFDDGYSSIYELAYPLLRRYGFPATVYLTTDAIAHDENQRSDDYPGLYGGERMLNWVQVREMSLNGIRIGSHLQHHRDLTLLSRAAATVELSQSKQIIEKMVGLPCERLSYPWGRCNRQVLRYAVDAGYKTAVTGIHGPIRRRTNALKIPRIDIRNDYNMQDFENICKGSWDFLGPLQRLRSNFL
jgi:peptidoglycan/xylan/chitin deacetylase (PgdA/CDA1 family)